MIKFYKNLRFVKYLGNDDVSVYLVTKWRMDIITLSENRSKDNQLLRGFLMVLSDD